MAVPQRFIDHCNLAVQGGEFVQDRIEFSITLKLNGKEIPLSNAMQRAIEKAKETLTSLLVSSPQNRDMSTSSHTATSVNTVPPGVSLADHTSMDTRTCTIQASPDSAVHLSHHSC